MLYWRYLTKQVTPQLEEGDDDENDDDENEDDDYNDEDVNQDWQSNKDTRQLEGSGF